MSLFLAALSLATAGEPCDLWQRPGDDVPVHCVRFGDSKWTYMSGGSHRLIGNLYPDFDVDAEGNTVGQAPAMDHRVRLHLGLGWSSVKFQTSWDLFDGQIVGDTWDIPGDIDERRRWANDAGSSFIPRRLSLAGTIADPSGGPVPLALIEAGLMPATWWGLGLLANGGDRETMFGRVDRGDRMLRARVSFTPWKRNGVRMPLFVTVGGDFVVEDDTARWNDGQAAAHAIASVLWRDAVGHKLGFFFTYRGQREPGDLPRPTRVGVLDLWGEVPFDLGATGWTAKVSTEDLLIVGDTQRVLSYGDLSATRVVSGAAVLRADVFAPNDDAHFRLEGGWTSATGDPDAGQLQDFTADRNFNVGVVLFDELMGALEAGTYAQLTDPSLTGSPPDGADALVTEGSVRRATWVWPALSVKPTGWLDLRAGYLAAWSTGPIGQAFYTARNGGTPTNHLDRETTGRFLGHEAQWGVVIGGGKATQSWRFRPKLWLEGSVGLPSEDLGGGVLTLARGTLQVDW